MTEGTVQPSAVENSYINALWFFCEGENIKSVHFAYFFIYKDNYKNSLRR